MSILVCGEHMKRRLQILYWSTIAKRRLDRWAEEILMREYAARYERRT